ncbi:hypothetical protein C4D60_Mb04t05500 [Musa balbisiana]|uniref:PHD-type domain-containing protein n=1 Tax=Musa balbisiana TaxID=52838 RepID=A0A4S8K9U7_MUSBA|nr:hypothetical protein C4D60_Mb04t05500 [Musa balbisiana]
MLSHLSLRRRGLNIVGDFSSSAWGEEASATLQGEEMKRCRGDISSPHAGRRNEATSPCRHFLHEEKETSVSSLHAGRKRRRRRLWYSIPYQATLETLIRIVAAPFCTEVKVCDICGDSGLEELLAFCSRCSDGAEHTYCMQVRLDTVPESEWVCEECRLKEAQNQMIGKFESQLEAIEAVCSSENSQSIESTSKSLPGVENKAVDLGTRKDNKELDKLILSKRTEEKFDVTKEKISEACGASTGTTVSRKPTLVVCDNTINKSDLVKVKLPALVTSCGQSEGSFSKSVSFNKSKVPKVKQLLENIPHKQKMTREYSLSSMRKGGPSQTITKSASFRSESSGFSNVSTVGDVQLPNPPPCEDLRDVKQVKEKSMTDKRLFMSDRPFTSLSVAATSVSSVKVAPKVLQYEATPEVMLDPSKLSNNRGSKEATKFVNILGGLLANEVKQLPISPISQTSGSTSSVRSCKNEDQKPLHHLNSVPQFNSHQGAELIHKDDKTKDHTFLSNIRQAASVDNRLAQCQRGVFEVLKIAKPPAFLDGIQAHLSSYVSPKTLELVKKFPCKVQLEEVPRLSAWPFQSHENSPKEDNIALFFFAKDTERGRNISCFTDLPDLEKKPSVSSLNLEPTVQDQSIPDFSGLCSSYDIYDENSQDLSRFDKFPKAKAIISSSCSNIQDVPTSGNKDRILNIKQIPPVQNLHLAVSGDKVLTEQTSRSCSASCPYTNVSQLPNVPVSYPEPKLQIDIEQLPLEMENDLTDLDKLAGDSDSSKDSEHHANASSTSISNCEEPVFSVLFNCQQGNARNVQKIKQKEKFITSEAVPDDQVSDAIKLDDLSWESRHNKKHPLPSSAETIIKPTANRMLWKDEASCTSLNDTELKKMRLDNGGHAVCSSWEEILSSGLPSKIQPLPSGCLNDGIGRDTMCESSKNAERFFPIDLGTATSTKADNLIYVLSSEDEDSPESIAPDLELALWGKKRPPKTDSSPRLSPNVGIKCNPDKLLAPAVDDGDDMLSSLSLSLAFPATEKPRTAKPMTQDERLLPDKPCINTALLLFGGYTDT